MGRGDQIDIVHAFGNQLVIDFFQPGYRDFPAFVQTADFVILAVTTVEVAACEEDGTRSFCPAEAGLFPHVHPGPGNHRQDADAAAAEHAIGIGDAVGAVNAAAMGANIT